MKSLKSHMAQLRFCCFDSVFVGRARCKRSAIICLAMSLRPVLFIIQLIRKGFECELGTISGVFANVNSTLVTSWHPRMAVPDDGHDATQLQQSLNFLKTPWNRVRLTLCMMYVSKTKRFGDKTIWKCISPACQKVGCWTLIKIGQWNRNRKFRP